MKNKGFTIIELLVSFAIIALVISIAIISFNSINKKAEINYYKTLEESLLLSGNDYFESHQEELPINGSRYVSIEKLINNRYIEPLKDKNGNDCTSGNVFVYRNNGSFSYEVCLECGSYKSEGVYCNGNIGEINVDAYDTTTHKKYNTSLTYSNVGIARGNVSATFAFVSNDNTEVSRYVIKNTDNGNTIECKNIDNSTNKNNCTHVFEDSGSYTVTAYNNDTLLSNPKEVNVKIDKLYPNFEIEAKKRYVIEDSSDKKHISIKIKNIKDDFGIDNIKYCYQNCYDSQNVKNDNNWVITDNIDTQNIDLDLESKEYTLFVEVTDLTEKSKMESVSFDVSFLIKLQYTNTHIEHFEVISGKKYGYLNDLPAVYKNKPITWYYLNDIKDNDSLVELKSEHTLTIGYGKVVDEITANAYCNKVTYNGEYQLLTKGEPAGVIFTNNVQKDVNKEGYPIKIKLIDGYVWSDGSTGDKTIYCPINNYTSEDILEEIIDSATDECNPIYKEDGISYLSGTNECNNMNYIWYSGKLWRITAIYPDGAMKLITENSITCIKYDGVTIVNQIADFKTSDANTTSYVYYWLNEDFYDTLYHASEFIDTTKRWNATKTDSADAKPNETTMVSANVGLLNSYEYYNSYRNLGDYSNGYLNINGFWWLLNQYPNNIQYDNRLVRGVNIDGNSNYRLAPHAGGVRPSIYLKSGLEFTGSGTKNNPYRISGDKAPGKTNDLINTRLSGEYIKLKNGNNGLLFRIIDVENDKTKIIIAQKNNDYPISNTFSSDPENMDDTLWGSGTTIGTNSWPYTWYYYLNNTYLPNLKSTYGDLFDSATYYLGRTSDMEGTNDGNYKLSVCANTTSGSTKVCDKTLYKGVFDIGLPRYGEMFATVQGVSNYSTWLINRNNERYVWRVTSYDQGYVTTVTTTHPSGTHGLTSSGGCPTLHLKSTVKILSGTGTKNDPYVVGL